MDVPVRHVVFSLLCGLFILGSVLELIRRSKLQERHAVLWVVVAIAFMTYGWWVAPLDAVANWFRVDDVVSVVLFFGVLLSALLILQLSVKVSEFSIKIKNLVQEVSMLKHELERRVEGGNGQDDDA